MPPKAKAVKKPGVAKKKANGYKMPAPIATGEVIHDTIGKKKWRIGPSIGVGGFGEIYSACDHDSSPNGSNYPFVVKIEPHENGPLFVEKHFYVRNANKDDIANFMKSKKLSSFGMPTYFGNGSHDYKGEKYRYLVLERYGKDLWNLFKDNGRCFPPVTVFQIGLQMLDVLEYIHSRGYVHADIKGANILMGLKKATENQAYLVDFGLASRVNDKEFKPDPKCAHNGTIEYTSRDAHLGVATMRGDLEILGYNLLQWLVGVLPWEKDLNNPKLVQEQKESFMKSVRSRITKDYSSVPNVLIQFFEYINSLKPKDVPDYIKCRNYFETYLKSEGKTRTSKIEFSNKKDFAKKTKTQVNNKINDSSEEVKAKRVRKPKVTVNDDDHENVELNDSSEEVKAKRVRKPKVTINDDDHENVEPNDSSEEVKAKRVRKPKVTVNDDDHENVEPNDSIESKIKSRRGKRKSMEPAVLVKVKKTKMAPKATPPAKKNHNNMATQTSVEKPRKSPRQVSFDSPICEIIGEPRTLRGSRNNSANSSGDIFEDSFTVEGKKIKPRKKLLSDEEVTVKRIVKKKTTVQTKARSWKNNPAVVNGRSPPK